MQDFEPAGSRFVPGQRIAHHGDDQHLTSPRGGHVRDAHRLFGVVFENFISIFEKLDR